MANLVQSKKFVDDGVDLRTSENFQGYYFDRIDLTNRQKPISFQRSDFRGAKFEKCIFLKNDFSNADFIDCATLDSEFSACKFEFSELYNSYFLSNSYSNCDFSSASFVKLIFTNTKFSDTNFSVNTFRNCQFSKCNFINCHFEKNSIDDIEFFDTAIQDTDLSNMTAINLYFSNCELTNVIIDADYIGSYFFKGKTAHSLRLKYRGKIFDYDLSQTDLFSNLFKIYLEQGRLYEAINISIQKNVLENKVVSIIPLVLPIIDQLLVEENEMKRQYQFDKIFKLFEYYIDSNYLPATDFFSILGFLEQVDLSGFSFAEQLSFIEKVARFKLVMDRMNFDLEFYKSIPTDLKVSMEITIEEKDKLEFEENFNLVINHLGDFLELSPPVYTIVNIRKGSLIFEIVIYSSAGLLLLKLLRTALSTARQVMNESMQLIVDYKLNKKMLIAAEKLKMKHTIGEIKEIRQTQGVIVNKQIDEQTLAAVEKLIPYIKSGVVYPNTLPDTFK